MSTLKAVFFDLDGTLIESEIDFHKMKRRSIRFLEEAGVDKELLTEELLNYDIEKLAFENLRKKGYSEVEIQCVFRKVADIMNKIELEAIEGAKLLDGAVETLVELRELGLKIGIITRGCRRYANKILEKFELERLIDAVAARDDILKPKPDPEHPRYLMKILGVKSSETVMVGDHPMDALCAKNVGMRFFLVPKRNTNLMAFKEYCYETLQNLRDIVYILKTKGSSAPLSYF